MCCIPSIATRSAKPTLKQKQKMMLRAPHNINDQRQGIDRGVVCDAVIMKGIMAALPGGIVATHFVQVRVK